jgi:hypothetical protein
MTSAKRKLRIYEVPITYHTAATYEEGKKIGLERWNQGHSASVLDVLAHRRPLRLILRARAAFSTTHLGHAPNT